jgi:hypothetical protein
MVLRRIQVEDSGGGHHNEDDGAQLLPEKIRPNRSPGHASLVLGCKSLNVEEIDEGLRAIEAFSTLVQ